MRINHSLLPASRCTLLRQIIIIPRRGVPPFFRLLMWMMGWGFSGRRIIIRRIVSFRPFWRVGGMIFICTYGGDKRYLADFPVVSILLCIFSALRRRGFREEHFCTGPCIVALRFWFLCFSCASFPPSYLLKISQMGSSSQCGWFSCVDGCGVRRGISRSAISGSSSLCVRSFLP